MTELHAELIADIITDFSNSKQTNALYFSINSKAISNILESISPEYVLSDLSDPAFYFSPLAPFLKILQISYNNEEIRHIYPLQQKCFSSYLHQEPVSNREDILLLEEIYYEQKQFRESIITLLTDFNKTRITIVHAELLQKEAIDLLKEFTKKKKHKLILIFSKEALYESDSYDVITEFLSEIMYQDSFYDIELDEYASSPSAPHFGSMDILLDGMKNSAEFLSITGGMLFAEEFLRSDYEKLLSKEKIKEALLTIGRIYLYAGNTDEALLYFNSVIGYNEYDAAELLAFIYTSQLLYLKNDFVNALKYARLAASKSDNAVPEYIRIISEELIHITSYRINRKYELGYYRQLLNRLKNSGLINNYIYASNMYWSIDQTEEEKHLTLEFIEDSIIASLETGNDFSLSTAYQWKGIFLSQIKNETKAMDYYMKAIEIREQIGDILPLVKVRNGLGYACLLKSDYTRAYSILSGIFKRISEIKHDYTEITMTMFNFAMVLFYGRHYENSVTILKSIQKIMNIFEINKLPFHNRFDIELIRGVIHCIRGDYSRSMIIYSKIMLNFDTLNTNNKPIAYFLGALLSVHRNELMQGLDLFRKSQNMVITLCSSQTHYSAWAYFEFAVCLKLSGFTEFAENIWSDGKNFSVNEKLSYWNTVFTTVSPDKATDYSMDIQPVELSLQFIENNAAQEKLANRLHKHLRDMQYINHTLQISTGTEQIIGYCEAMALTISNYLISASVYIASRDNGEWLELAAHSKHEDFICDAKTWESYYMQGSQNLIREINEYELQNSRIFFTKLDKFGFTGGILIVTDHELLITSEDMKILDMILTNLQSQLVMLKQNEELKKLIDRTSNKA